MKVSAAHYCKRCQFYHGESDIICAVHPYGPGDGAVVASALYPLRHGTCRDFQPKTGWKTHWQSIHKSLEKFAAKDMSWFLFVCSILSLGAIYSFFDYITNTALFHEYLKSLYSEERQLNHLSKRDSLLVIRD
ncbi:hypothetical protein [Fischerella sp. PCC 9605]|uniref:hypothetical protein n=1 Tax=Fischerella sp. PCC 9605 TaxID=1173024 RepID=UPI000479F2DD|nr:hypothetical protein [Fischerella sp. PCC 9605]